MPSVPNLPTINSLTGKSFTEQVKVAKNFTYISKYYEFTDNETNFLINYDIKYRMGNDDDE